MAPLNTPFLYFCDIIWVRFILILIGTMREKLKTTTIYDILEKNCSCFDLLEKEWIKQIDFLAFYVDPIKMSQNSPFDSSTVRDNPNWVSTEYENVYKMIDYDKWIMTYLYIEPWRAPIAVLRWDKQTIWTSKTEKWRISIYWKALKLFYSGQLDWLVDYVATYQDPLGCFRVDLCYDLDYRINEKCIWLKEKICLWDNLSLFPERWTYKWFGKKNWDIFIRIYDKTLDLKKDKNINAWLYPEWYKECCWRTEFKLGWVYSRAQSPLKWLLWLDRNLEYCRDYSNDRNYLWCILYNTIQAVSSYVIDPNEQYEILNKAKSILDSKLDRLDKNMIKTSVETVSQL